MWVAAALCSAVFAGAATMLSKCGVADTDSDVAVAVRTSVVLVLAWAVVFATGAQRTLSGICAGSWAFLVLSGLATGASWLCYFKALSLGEVSRVVATDKSSVVMSSLAAIVLFPGERTMWQAKLFCLALIAAGTVFMTDIRRETESGRPAWLFFALLSAGFAAASSLLAKAGITGVDSNAATAVRTCVVLALAWLVVLCRKKAALVRNVSRREAAFLVLSGLATGASWLCYYYAVQQGQVSIVVPIDKLSAPLTVLFSAAVFKERIPAKSWCGLALLTAGILALAAMA